MMGGSILLDSQVDVGSTFSFRIQLRPVKEHKIQEKAPQNKKDFSGIRVLVTEDNPLNMEILQYILMFSRNLSVPDFVRRFLSVVPKFLMRTVMKFGCDWRKIGHKSRGMRLREDILEDMGMKVDNAYDGKEAVDKFEASKTGYYDLIIMDIMMPVMGGLEAAHAIRTMERADSNKVPIVAISANAFDEDIHRSLASGMNAHLSKPVEIDKLRETLGKLLK